LIITFPVKVIESQLPEYLINASRIEKE